MAKFILAGIDLHDKSMTLKIAADGSVPEKRSFTNDAEGCAAMIAELKSRARKAGAERIVAAYEASALGFGLHDLLVENGIECHIFAPSKIARSPKHRRSKTDEKDADRLLEILRGHYLAGNKLPDIWIPGIETRDDRELLRARMSAQEKSAKVKTQIRMLLKRNGLIRPETAGTGWTKPYREWLKALSECDEPLRSGARFALGSLLKQLECLEGEIDTLDKEIEKLARTERYAGKVESLTKIKGVALYSALVFLAEMGDASRFSNRRQVGAFLGLVPSSDETGETDDRKGHITHQGPARVRYILCQIVWNRVRFDPDEKAVYERIVKKNPNHKKKAVVAAMRRAAIEMWHAAQPKGAA